MNLLTRHFWKFLIGFAGIMIIGFFALWGAQYLHWKKNSGNATVNGVNVTDHCSFNTYDCEDFINHKQAQEIYETCGGTGNDVHQLDRDKDGVACETLP